MSDEQQFVETKITQPQAEEFLRDMVIKYGPQTTLTGEKMAEEMGRYLRNLSFYRMKLAGYIWFDGEIPLDNNIGFIYLRNPDIATEIPQTARFATLTRKELLYRVRKMRKPQWAGGNG